MSNVILQTQIQCHSARGVTSSSKLWWAVRIFLATLSIGAAIGKGYAVATGQLDGVGMLGTAWVVLIVAECEFILGIYILAARSHRMWWVGFVAFFMFAAVSITRALQGNPSCGCFGSVVVSPWYTAGLDSFVLLLLLVVRCFPIGEQRSSQQVL